MSPNDGLRSLGLVEGLDLGRAGRALGDHERPYRLNIAVFGLARSLGAPGQGSAGRLDGVGRVGLACAPTGLAVGAVYLHNLYTRAPQVAGHARAVRTSALYAYLSDLAEALQPAEQVFVPSRVVANSATPSRPPIGSSTAATFRSRWVSTPPSLLPEVYDRHCHPFSRFCEGVARAAPVCGAGATALFSPGRSAAPKVRLVPLNLVPAGSCCPDRLSRQLTTSQARDQTRLTVVASVTGVVDPLESLY